MPFFGANDKAILIRHPGSLPIAGKMIVTCVIFVDAFNPGHINNDRQEPIMSSCDRIMEW